MGSLKDNNSIELLRDVFSYSTNDNPSNRCGVRKSPPLYYLDFKENIKFLMDHFEQPFFPRTISTRRTKNRQILVNSIFQVHEEFKRSNFIDCKISAFPLIVKPFPNFIFIDLDINNKINLSKSLEITIKNIKTRLGGSPSVLWTGNGLHVYQPLTSPTQIEDIAEFKEFVNPDNGFLRFEKDHLSEGYADSANYPSLKSCMLRVPGSLNSKCIFKGMKEDDSRVMIMKSWDRFRPSIVNQLGTFYSYLISEDIKNIKKDISISNLSHRYSSNIEIQWIENLLKTSLDDYRKFCLWRILIPYLINIKKKTQLETINILNEWLKASDSKRKLDFSSNSVIRDNIKRVNEFRPISKSRLKKECPYLYHKLIIKHNTQNMVKK